MKKDKTIRTITLLLVIAAAMCGFFYARAYRIAQEEISVYADVQRQYTTTIQTHVPGNISTPHEAAGLPYIEVDFDALLLKNPDTVGWVAIPNTVISYPVVQAADNAKYLNLSFDGSRSSAGTPFADMNNNMRHLDKNTIIYGHNMGAGRTDMFSSLLLYKDYDYYMAHRYIRFDTIYQRHGWWKVFAVIELDAHNTDFMDWAARAAELSIHETDTNIAPHDRILTLSTCDRSRHGQHGRLLILAVKIG